MTELSARIRRHLDHNEGYVAFSGGKDSLVVLDLARHVDPEVPIAFFDSGLEFPETLIYIERIANLWNLNLTIIPAQPTALELLIENGTWDHKSRTALGGNFHQALIAGPAASAHATFGPGELWGVRSEESRGRRIAHAKALSEACACTPACQPVKHAERHGGVITRRDGSVAFSPVWNWSSNQVWGHIAHHQLPVNPVYDVLERIGAPLHSQRLSTLVDATQMSAGRFVWLKRGWPSLFEQVSAALPRIKEYT